MSSTGEFLMKAQKYVAGKSNIAGHYISEKLPGVRCFWDGGISRGVLAHSVPWANLNTSLNDPASGLWTQYGHVIDAPDWWLNQLPCIPLDGHLCNEREDSDWLHIDYVIYSTPPFENVFKDRVINKPPFKMTIRLQDVKRWLNNRPECFLVDYRFLPADITFESELALLQDALVASECQVYLAYQRKIPTENTEQFIKTELKKIQNKGGKGLIIRDPQGIWLPERVSTLLEYTEEN
jgi:hypothetical protein